MSKVKYHKHCRKHAAVQKTKRTLNALIKKCSLCDAAIYIELTGIEELDYREMKYYIKKHMELQVKNIQDEINENKEEDNGYYIPKHLQRLLLVKGLQELQHYIYNSYAEFKNIQSLEVVLTKESNEDKVREYNRYFELNPHLVGFNRTYFAIATGKPDVELFPFTSLASQLTGVEKIRVVYE